MICMRLRTYRQIVNMSESREEENPQIVCQKISEPRKLPHRKENQENMFEGIGKGGRRGGG